MDRYIVQTRYSSMSPWEDAMTCDNLGEAIEAAKDCDEHNDQDARVLHIVEMFVSDRTEQPLQEFYGVKPGTDFPCSMGV